MSGITPRQRRVRERIEGLIGVAAPVLDLVLAAGDRVSRIVSPEDHEQYPVHPAAEPALLEPPAGRRAADEDGNTG
ncbi:MAG: hypothetical protein ABWZ63_06045 [Thermoleophilaceae bacterium]